jgi:anti-sigma B factor antagonist
MKLSIDRHDVSDGVVRLAVAGEVDLATCDQLRTAIQASLADAHVAELIIDLDQVTFLDSTGIRTLVQGRNHATENGISWYVTNPNHMVHRVLAVTGVLLALTIPA